MFDELKNLSLDCEIMLLENARYFDLEADAMMFTESSDSLLVKIKKTVSSFIEKIVEIIENFVDMILTKIKQAIIRVSLKNQLEEVKKAYVNQKLEIDRKIKGKKFQLFDRIKYTREINKAIDLTTKIIAKYDYGIVTKMSKETVKKSLTKDVEYVEKLILQTADIKVGDSKYFKAAKDFKEIIDSATNVDEDTNSAIKKMKDIHKTVCGNIKKSVNSAKDVDVAEIYNYAEYRSLINKFSLFMKKAMYSLGHFALYTISLIGSAAGSLNILSGITNKNPGKIGKGAAYGAAGIIINEIDNTYVKPKADNLKKVKI